MIKLILFLVFSVIVSVLGQATLLAQLRIINPNPYFAQVAQETIYEFEEKKEWCSLRLNDFTQTLNEITHTNRHVTGEVSYSNGFLVSIEKIDVTTLSPLVTSPIVNGVAVTTATVRGHINFRDAKVGYDVLTNVTGDDRQRRYTGIFTHNLIQTRFDITKNMNTNVTTVGTSVLSTAGGSGVRMVYMPTDEISQILSWRFEAGSSSASASRWMREEMGPIMLDIVRNKIKFPDVRFNS